MPQATPTPPLGAPPPRSVAESYQSHVVPAIGTPVAERLLDVARPGLGERVLDVACGTGVVTRLAHDAVGPSGRVVGADVTPAMLDVAREVSLGDIDWVEAPADDLPLPDSSIDLALCSMGMQFFPDRVAALAEMQRVLVPGGRIAWCTPGPTPPPYGVIAAALERHVGPAAAGFVGMVFGLHDPDEAGDLMASAGFERIEVRATPVPMSVGPPGEFLWNYLGSTPTAAVVAPLDGPTRAALEADVVEGCAPFLEDGSLALTTNVLIATGHRPVAET